LGCHNVGDEHLEAALRSGQPQPGSMVDEALDTLVKEHAESFLAGLTEQQRRSQLAELTTQLVGEVGERAIAKVLAATGHTLIAGDVDTHAPGEGGRRANDFTAISDDGELRVFEVKTTRNGRQLARANETGGHDLSRPRLSRTADGRRQLDDTYNLTRMHDIITFDEGAPAHGEGARSYAVKIDLVLLTYQMFEVDVDGRVVGATGPQVPAAAEIAEALCEVRDRAGRR
jgi:hypothetical protein